MRTYRTYRRFTALLAVLACTVLLLPTGCRSRTGHNLSDFDSVIYAPRYATGFDIRSAHGMSSTLLTVRNPWQGATDVVKQLFISRNGEPAPKGFGGEVIHGSAGRIVCMSTSYIAMLDALGCNNRIVGVSGIDYILNDSVRQGYSEGRVADVGYDSETNFERILALAPDIVLLYGVSGDNSIVTGKLQELGIPYFYIGDYLEESPLGKAEWLVAMAEIAGCHERGIERFDSIAARYERQRTAIAGAISGNRPTVMFNTPYRDTWYMPSSRSYAVRLVEDAGGRYIYEGNNSNSSQAIDLEQAYLLAEQADCWINVDSYASLDQMRARNPRFAQARALRNGRVYAADRRTTPAGGSDFWESAIVNPDIVLRDLIAILHPETADSTELYYYRKIE